MENTSNRQITKAVPVSRAQPLQPWKARRKELQKEGRFATIMRAYVINSDRKLSASHAVRQQTRIPSYPHLASPKVFRDTRLLVGEHDLAPHTRDRPESEEDRETAVIAREASAWRSLTEQAFASKQLFFNDFPLAKKGLVSDGFDYFLGKCAITVLGKPSNWNWRTPVQDEYSIWYFQNILRSDILFELVVAYALTLRLYLLKDLAGSRPTQAVAFHIQNALLRLQERLESGDAWADDSTFWSVIMCCAVTYVMRDFDAFKIHARGMHQMVALRGGVDSLDKFGFFKKRVVDIDSSLSAMAEQERKGMLAKTTLIYHHFPLLPRLIQQLSKFPPGFAEIPFEIRFSENMIDFVDHNLKAIKHPPPPPAQINGVETTVWILNLPLSEDERLVALALITRSLYHDRLRRAQVSVLNNYRVQKEFLRLTTTAPLVKRDYVRWALLTLRNTVRYSPELAKWIAELLAPLLLTKELITWLEARFIPIPKLLAHHERQPDEL